jgi:hypothetical protein
VRARLDPQAIATWLLGFGLVAYLGLNGGGYEPGVLRDQLGIAVWWGVVLGLAVGALPLSRLRYGSWIALGLLGAYVAWVALSAAWSTTPEGSFADLGRVATYLGVLALALSIRGRGSARRMVTAVGSAIALVAIVALLSRLQPTWFPEAQEGIRFGIRNRLSYPLGYWNGVAGLIALGLPLLLYVACSSRRLFAQALTASVLPAMALTVYLTLSRGGTAAAILALVLFMALVPDRLPKLATLLGAGVGSTILIAAASQRDALTAGFTGPVADRQGDEMLAMVLVVGAGVGLMQVGLAIALRHGRRPNWSRPSRRISLALLVTAIAVAMMAAVAFGAPGKASDAWGEFKRSEGPPTGAARFGSFSGNGRWPYWKSALASPGTARAASSSGGPRAPAGAASSKMPTRCISRPSASSALSASL